MLPDLEIPFIVVLFGTSVPHHLVLHSLPGALVVGTALGVVITVFIYPRLTGAIFPVDKFKVKKKCKFSSSLVFSCAVGCLSHVLLDVTNHAYNPLFWPFLAPNDTPSPVVPVLGGVVTASLLVHAVMIVLFIGLFVGKRDGFWEHLLVG